LTNHRAALDGRAVPVVRLPLGPADAVPPLAAETAMLRAADLLL
jgi:hypothetical protein